MKFIIESLNLYSITKTKGGKKMTVKEFIKELEEVKKLAGNINKSYVLLDLNLPVLKQLQESEYNKWIERNRRQ